MSSRQKPAPRTAQRSPAIGPAVLGIALMLAGSAGVADGQVSGTWAINGSGNYATAANWTSMPSVPGSGGVATFGPIATADVLATLNASPSLRGITFNDAAASYTLNASGANAITLVPSTTGDLPRLEVLAGTHTINAPLAGTASIAKFGPGTLVLGGPSTFAGNTSVNAGVLRVTTPNALGPAGPSNAVGVQAGGVLELANSVDLGSRDLAMFTPTAGAPNGALRSVGGTNAIGGSIYLIQSTTVGVDAGSTLTLAGDFIDGGLSGGSVLTKAGTGELIVKRVGGANAGPGGAAQPLAGLAVSAGVVRVTPNGSNTSRINGLTIANGATFDLSDNALVVDYASASPLAAIRGYLAAGRLLAGGVGTRRIGYAEAGSVATGGTFAGQAVDATAIVARASLPGDANLDGSVSFDDLLSLAQHYGGGGYWSEGDFDYSGTVDFDDLLTLAQNYGTGGELESTGIPASATGFSPSFAADWTLARSNVPEPVFAGPLAALIGRRRQRSRKSCARL